jgi:hypothetical protein
MIQDPGLQVKAAETDDEPSPTSTNELDTPSALVITVSARLSEYEKWSAEKRTLDMSTESGHRMVIWKGQGLPMSTTGCQKAQDTSTVISRVGECTDANRWSPSRLQRDRLWMAS